MTGTRIGPYEIQEQLGAGGMGVVYKALDTQLDRTVALKFLPLHAHNDEAAKSRFVQEAKAASALDHANICTIHHIGESDDGQVYIAMSFYEGQTLKYRLSEGSFSEEEAISVAKQILAGLSRAHAAGIVHRDIKPANIMVTNHGEVKILDFGIAKLSGSSDLTHQGATLGTVAYMSPEQARGETVGPAADLWSLGVVFYEMLSGKRPFDANYDQALLYAILNEPAVGIREVAPSISPETAAVVEQLLAKNAKERPESARAVIHSLGGATGTLYTQNEPRQGAALPASLMRVLVMFAGFGALGLAAVYGAVLWLGLPDWVFLLGAVLLLIGAPITVYASFLDRNRAQMNTGQKISLSGLSSWLTLRKAIMGGVFAMAGLGVFTAVFMLMRAMGIGPAATLISSGAMGSGDIIIVADFEDQTASGEMGISIAEAFKVDLSQSDIVTLVDDSAVRDALRRMELSAEQELTPEIAVEIAIREGAKAALVGDIASLGSNYVLRIKLVEAASGKELISLRETAPTDADIVNAVDRLSASLRELIGESLISIRKSEPLEKVTTSSMDALRFYTLAEKAKNRGDADLGIQYALQAVEYDPAFAMAYRILASMENNRHGSSSKMIEYARKAYEHKDRLTKTERYAAEDAYYTWVERGMVRRVPNLLARLEEAPGDIRATNALSLYYRYTGDEKKALEYSWKVIQLAPRNTLGYINSWYAYTRLEDWDMAQVMLDSVKSIEPEFAGMSWMKSAQFAEKTGNYVAALDSFSRAFEAYSDDGEGYFLATYMVSIYAMLGRFEEADAMLKRSAEINEKMENREGIIWDRMYFTTYRYFADGDKALANERIDEVFRMVDPSTLDTLAREYTTRGYALAAVGRIDEAKEVLKEQARYVPASWLVEDDAVHLTEGMIALHDGQYDKAIEDIKWVRANLNTIPRVLELELAMAMVAANRLEEAIPVLESAARGKGWAGLLNDFGASSLSFRLLGETYDRMGQTEQAIEAYEMFVERWQNADAVLQPQVKEVQDRIATLLDRQSTDQ